MAHMDWMIGKEKKEKSENRGEKRISVIHTDSVVMKGIESFIIYRAYGKAFLLFSNGKSRSKGCLYVSCI